MPNSTLSQRLAFLPRLRKPALRELWQQLFQNEPPPTMRKELMLRVISHRLQEQKFGGLNDASRRQLRQLATPFQAHPKAAVSTGTGIRPGTRLVRQWKDQVHVVEVEPEGYQYKGARYESLSEIARLITGTRWSGPVFFGLKGKPAKESRAAQ